MSSPFRVGALDDSIPRDDFGCGNEVLDRYFKTQITQDIRRRIASAFVAIDAGSGQVAGYYTLAATSIPLTALAEEISRKLPRVEHVFAGLHQMGGMLVRTIGLALADFQITMKLAVYNLKRWVSMRKCGLEAF